MTKPSRLYRLLLLAYPRDVRRECGADMAQLFADRLRATTTRRARARLWLLGIGDVVGHSGRERASRAGRAVAAGWRAVSPGEWRWRVSMLWQDLRFAIRLHARTPVVTLAALVTLALGVGANAAIFSFADALLFRPLPVRDPARVMSIFHVDLDDPGGFSGFARPDFLAFRDGTTVFSGLAARTSTDMDVGEGDSLERLTGEAVSYDYFEVLGLRPVVGRWFTADEDRVPGASPVAVISHALWRRRFGADPGAVGGSIVIDGRPFTVIGVAPSAFRGLDVYETPDVWVPQMMYETVLPWLNALGQSLFDNPTTHWMDLVGRLADGVSPSAAEAALATIADRQTREIVKAEPGWRWGVRVVPVNDARLGPPTAQPVVRLTALLATVVALVLLIACANVANLMLARSLARRREIGIRLAVGAGRARLVRQLLTESLLLSVAGGTAGVLLAGWATHLLGAFELPAMLPGLAMRIDGRVLAFTLGLTLMTGVAFGLLPAWQASRVDVIPALKGAGGARSDAPRRTTLRQALVVGQVALCAVLLVGTGLALRTIGNLYALPLGFDAGRVTIASLDLGPAGLTRDAAARAQRDLVERLSARSGIEGASLALTTPFGGLRMANDIFWEPDVPGGERQRTNLDMNVVGPGYFEAMGIGLVRGRPFTWQDRAGASGVAIVNESLAARLWPREDAVGRRVWFWNPNGENLPLDIVGVVRDGRYVRGWRGAPQPFLFLPSTQMYYPTMSLIVRAGPSGVPTLADLREDVRALAPGALVVKLQPATAAMADAVALERMSAKLLSLFGLLALILAAVGIYGVVSFAVAERTREMGVRMALGAARAEILRLMLARSLRPVLLGIGVGAFTALVLGRLITSLLFGVTPTDPVTFMAVAAALVAAGLLASYVPARRATRVDPVAALRAE